MILKSSFMDYKIIQGNLITKALSGEFDVIAHGVNCFCKQKSGIAKQMVQTFGTDTYPLEHHMLAGDMTKLGDIDFRKFDILDGKPSHVPILFMETTSIIVVNAYTQYNYGKNHEDGVESPLDYEALTLCMRKINHVFKDLRVGLPKIGAGLGGGDWDKILSIILTELTNVDLTIVEYKP